MQQFLNKLYDYCAIAWHLFCEALLVFGSMSIMFAIFTPTKEFSAILISLAHGSRLFLNLVEFCISVYAFNVILLIWQRDNHYR